MKLQQLLSYTRKAVDEYQMIEEGDHIAVGISGGKDSLTLLYALHGLKRFYPKKFELSAITVDMRNFIWSQSKNFVPSLRYLIRLSGRILLTSFLRNEKNQTHVLSVQRCEKVP